MSAPTSPSFPNGLPERRSEAEVRAERSSRLSMLDVIAPKRDRYCGHYLCGTSQAQCECGRVA